jgi:hypothetical protein
MVKLPVIAWADQPESHDYPAAAAYLSLIADPAVVDVLIVALRAGVDRPYKAKDILRAARLPLLGSEDREVANDLRKIHDGKALSPVLLVRGSITEGRPMHIVDGYHRTCAAYQIDEDADIPCRIA